MSAIHMSSLLLLLCKLFLCPFVSFLLFILICLFYFFGAEVGGGGQWGGLKKKWTLVVSASAFHLPVDTFSRL